MPEEKTLAWRAIEGIKKGLNRVVVADYGSGHRKKTRAAKLLAMAMVLAEQIRELPQKRVGIVLPPSTAGFLVNLAVALANKSSVNLNFTTSTGVLKKAMEVAGIKTIITSQVMIDRLKEFPWTADLWELKQVFSQPGIRRKTLKYRAQAHILSVAQLTQRWKIKRYSDEEATLLFSSGSTGTPKGVPLTHGNIGANIDQIEEVRLLPTGTRILGCLPIFHSFGLTVTLWYPLCHTLRVSTYPNPIDTEALGKIIRKEKPTQALERSIRPA